MVRRFSVMTPFSLAILGVVNAGTIASDSHP
jgi:hypothetical protein